MAYATLTDVYRLALTARAFVVAPRPLDPKAGDSLDFATGTFSLTGHGLSGDDVVRIVVPGGGGAPTGAPLVTPLHVLPLDFWRFKLALTQGGAALTFADAGTFSAGYGPSAWTIQIDPEARILAHLEDTAGRINEHLTAHAPPIQPDPITGLLPPVLIGLNARMAGRAAVTSLQIETASYRVAVDRLFAQAKADGDADPPAQKGSLLGDWKAGKPIQPRPTDETPRVPDNAAIFGHSRRNRGMDRRVL